MRIKDFLCYKHHPSCTVLFGGHSKSEVFVVMWLGL